MDFPGEKLIIKLSEMLFEKGIGSLFEPWQIRRKGRALNDAQREEKLMLAQIEKDIMAIREGTKRFLSEGTLIDQPLDEKVAMLSEGYINSLTYEKVNEVAKRNASIDTVRREINLAKAIHIAEENLQNDDQEPSNDKVSDDWIYRWRDHAANVSSDELQELWGKALAGEVKNPGSYSLRMLELMRNLSQDEAKLIEKIAPFAVHNIIFKDQKNLESEGINFDLLLSLQNLGILSGVDGMGVTTTFKSESSEVTLCANNRILMITNNNPVVVFQVESYPLTKIGKQILSLGTFEANEDYLRVLGAHIKAKGFDVKIGDRKSVGNNQSIVINMKPL